MTAETGPASLPTTTIEWMTAGTAAFESAADAIGDGGFTLPSHLPGWTRAHVVAHIARNADALLNLLTWARTGVETPMYSGGDQRAREIEEGARRPPRELRADLRAANARLAEAVTSLPGEAWRATVRTARGREVPAWQVPWMRVREVCVHAVDLDTEATFNDVPTAVCMALLDDVAAGFTGRDDVPPVLLKTEDDDRAWTLGPSVPAPERVVVSGSPASLAAYATGRPVPSDLRPFGDMTVPKPPAWL
jgi:maleylpyruvate isomerase